jgi:Zn-dependent peptidase ImmA (M78 family)
MWSFEKIELEARKLLAEIEKNAGRLWPNTQPSRLFMCDPEAACRLLGLEYLPDSHLGCYGGTATAGMLDRKGRAVLLSYNQNFESLRFTAAHEVGHWILHPEQHMFRDRTLSAPGGPGRPLVEQEADYFGACFLIPPKLVREAFQARFPVREPITNTGAVCFNLSVRNAQYLEGLPPGSVEFALAIARTEFFNGRNFRSLASLFNVSPTAMAIRLLELGLVN